MSLGIEPLALAKEEDIELTEEQLSAVNRLKGYYPYDEDSTTFTCIRKRIYSKNI